MDGLEVRLTLGRAPALHADQVRGAVGRLGPIETLIGQRAATLESAGLPQRAARWLQNPDPQVIAADRRCSERAGLKLLACTDPAYPAQLAECPQAPALLYVKGDPACLSSPQLAVVGSRSPTPPARRTASEFAAALVRSGLTITSGLALGIDAAAHEGALAGAGLTVAVLGCGLDVIYPPQHRALAIRIASQGALVSEFAPGVAPLRDHFPRRNRIISGLSLGVLVVEASRHSGSLITARLAGEQGREVFAIPGSIHNPLSRGCHSLIRSGATLVETVDDVLGELHIYTKQHVTGDLVQPEARGNPTDLLDKDYKILLDALGFEPAGVDALVVRTGLSSQSIASMLLILELQGLVAPHVGGQYVRMRTM